MKSPLQARRGTLIARSASWVRPLLGLTQHVVCAPAQCQWPRPGAGRASRRAGLALVTRLAFAAGLIAALALAQPARPLAQQAVTLSSVTGAPVPAAMAGSGFAEAPAPANVDERSGTASDTLGVDTVRTTPDAEPSSPPPTSAGAARIWMADRPAVAANTSDTSDILPFAQNEIPTTFPSVGLAIGFATYLSGFTTVEQAFHTLEDTYRAGGFSVPRAGDVDLGPMLLPTLKARFTKWLDVALQLGRAKGSNDELTLKGGLVSGRYTLPRADRVSLFAGLGAGTYRFSFQRDYGVRVSPVEAGGYYRLDRITIEGGGRYWTTAGGLTIRAGPHGAFEVLVQYLGTGDVSTDARSAGKVSLNMSGAMIGVSFTSFFR